MPLIELKIFKANYAILGYSHTHSWNKMLDTDNLKNEKILFLSFPGNIWQYVEMASVVTTWSRVL